MNYGIHNRFRNFTKFGLIVPLHGLIIFQIFSLSSLVNLEKQARLLYIPSTLKGLAN